MAFRHVLVPTDFSDPANHALRYAVEEAVLHGSTVTLLHVQPSKAGTDVYYVTGAPASGLEAGRDAVAYERLGTVPMAESTVVLDDSSEETLARLRDLVPEAFRGNWDVEIAVGPPADTIVRLARERHADLIVMATHGRTGLGHAVLGSVAEKVVRVAPCPVLTIKYAGNPSGGARRIGWLTAKLPGLSDLNRARGERELLNASASSPTPMSNPRVTDRGMPWDAT